MVADIIAIVISFIAFIFSLIQFFIERNRTRKEATIHAFDKLEESKNFIFLLSLSKSKIDSLVKSKMDCENCIDPQWEELSKALPLIEHFAVGINSKTYNIDILNRMAGNQMISLFYNCGTLIQYKRTGQGKEKNYIEFETMVKKLIEIRQKNNQSIPENTNNR
ncbi:MAG: hypothetical protein IKV79_01675 [Oscillospiraceae bacterium]|nr:hypothetical protein [Oscillospiraceae bacterium]